MVALAVDVKNLLDNVTLHKDTNSFFVHQMTLNIKNS